jgi:transcriptional regulator with XRE-family HTH domain
MENSLKLRAAQRLARLIRQTKMITAIQLADLLSLSSERAVSDWCNGKFPIPRVRQIAAAMGISVDYFFDEDALFQERGDAFYLFRKPLAEATETQMQFDGWSTLMLARLIEANKDSLPSLRTLRIESYGGLIIERPAHELQAYVKGYQRTIYCENGFVLGGANAVLEDLCLKRIDLIGVQGAPLMLPGGRFPCLSDALLPAHGLLTVRMLRDLKLTVEAIHYCGRLPCKETFVILWQILEANQTNFAICEYAFDTVKRFTGYFLDEGLDALRMSDFLRRYVQRHKAEPEAQTAISYAIEALPNCSYTNLNARKGTLEFLRKIVARGRDYENAEDGIIFAAQAAFDFLPFVCAPERYST